MKLSYRWVIVAAGALMTCVALGAMFSLAIFLETGVTAAYLGLVGTGDAGLRAFGARAMQHASIRATSWRGSTVAFPGMPAARLSRPRAR